MALPDETELIARARQGNVDAFCVLVSAHQRRMYLLAYRFCGNHHDAEDLSQEVLLSAFRAIGDFKGMSAFHTWLRRIMVNSFLNHKRKSGTRTEIAVNGDAHYPMKGSERVAFNHVIVQQILQRLEEIPPRQRLMFIMKHQEGLTCEEIAEHFGTTVGTVKKTLFRVVDRLREEFQTPEAVVSEASNARMSDIP